jgi:hypothetical protein
VTLMAVKKTSLVLVYRVGIKSSMFNEVDEIQETVSELSENKW